MLDDDFNLTATIDEGKTNRPGTRNLLERFVDCFPEYGDLVLV